MFWQKKKPEPIRLEIDYHSHILPGVDDGISTMEDSLRVLKRYEELGITSVWCTPHVMEDCPNTTEGLKARFAELQEAYDGPVRLHLAAEYMMDTLFMKRLAAKDLLTIDGQVLVETSYFNPPVNLDDILDEIKSRGFFPILAHPERYLYMDKSDYKRLKADGIRFQLNIGSLKGVYGRHALAKATWLYGKSWYDYAGSDLHRYEMTSLLAD